MASMYKIMIVEDDLTIAKGLKIHLEKWDFTVKYIEDFNAILSIFTEFDPQMVLLDISLPFYNGFYWCSEIRKISKVPIIFLSSANDNMNLIMAMNMGADDFIAKPVELNVVVAKIQALLRRSYSFQSFVNILEHKGVVLNLGDASFVYKEQKIDLTKNEFKILQTLLENKGKVVSRDTIIKQLWDDESYIDDNTLTVNVTRLRKKLDEAGLQNFIITKKGLGYLVED